MRFALDAVLTAGLDVLIDDRLIVFAAEMLPRVYQFMYQCRPELVEPVLPQRQCDDRRTAAPDERGTESRDNPGKYLFVGAFAVACGLAASFFLRRR